MEPKREWCDNPTCPDFGKIDAGNIRVHSYVERRYQCKTCRQTFSMDKGTFFETLRSPRLRVVETLAQLGERNSLRAVERLKQCPVNTVLAWLDLGGAHARAIRADIIRDLHLTQAQVDELWTFVKKNKRIATPMIQRTWATCGLGGP